MLQGDDPTSAASPAGYGHSVLPRSQFYFVNLLIVIKE